MTEDEMDGLGCCAALIFVFAIIGWWIYEDWKNGTGR